MKKNKYKEGSITFFPIGIIMSIIISMIITFFGNKEFMATGKFPTKTATIVGLIAIVALILSAIVTYLYNKEDDINKS